MGKDGLCSRAVVITTYQTSEISLQTRFTAHQSRLALIDGYRADQIAGARTATNRTVRERSTDTTDSHIFRVKCVSPPGSAQQPVHISSRPRPPFPMLQGCIYQVPNPAPRHRAAASRTPALPRPLHLGVLRLGVVGGGRRAIALRLRLRAAGAGGRVHDGGEHHHRRAEQEGQVW